MRSFDQARAVVRRVFSPVEPSNRALRLGLGGLAVIASLVALQALATGLPWGVDLYIPVQAASRWLTGGQAYGPESFANGSGYDLPFLYPPYALPLFAPLTSIPFGPLQATWFASNLAIAVAACRRLGIRWPFIPLLLVWPPFAEGFVTGNVQIGLFAAAVFVLTAASSGRIDEPTGRSRRTITHGLLGAITAFLKVSQPHVLVYQARWDRRAAVVAVLALAGLVSVTLPITGTSIWLEWLDQARRAANPDWVMGGPSLSRLLPPPLGTIVIIGCIAAVFAVPRADPAAWVGVLLVISALSLHTYYLLFLLPAMLRIRREIALVAAVLVTTYTEAGWWLAIALVAGALMLSQRYGAFLERASPARDDPTLRAGG